MLQVCLVIEESMAVGYLDKEMEDVCYRYVLSLKKQWQNHMLKMKQKWRSHVLQEYLAVEEPMAGGYLDIEMEVMSATDMSRH